MVGLGAFFAFVLSTADRKLRVEEDPRVKNVEEALAGLNCGACGYPSCQLAAEAIVKGEAEVNACIVGGVEVTDKVARVMGKEAKETEKKTVAIVHCGIDNKTRQLTSKYQGNQSCAAANLIMQGGMACKYGCLGLGDCIQACPVGGVSLKGGLPVIDIQECLGCGMCEKACPRSIISLHSYILGERIIYVACNNPEPGKGVRKVCKVGCIACSICEKLSDGIFEVKNNLSRINWEKSREKEINWDQIIQKCPTKCIWEKK